VIAQAFRELHNSSIITRSFEYTGIDLSPDGSNNGEISVKGFNQTELDIASWREKPLQELEVPVKAEEDIEAEFDPDIGIRFEANSVKFASRLARRKAAFVRQYASWLGITTLTVKETKRLTIERILEYLTSQPGSQSNPLVVEAPQDIN
jgi:hypothetical protein